MLHPSLECAAAVVRHALIGAACALTPAVHSYAQETAPVVSTGLDVLVDSGFEPLRGRNVGLITNHTGRTRDGTGIVDAFLAQDACRLRVLFSPEHGFAGLLDQSKIDDAKHSSGLAIKSLYGETRKPSREMLAGLDTLVFDIQDIGCRFYTYVSTMKLAMEAATESELHFVVLDRPNPIGGQTVAGPILAPGDESFIAAHTIPLQHGMTVGELARMLHDELGLKGSLSVVECAGWQRSMRWDETGLTWVNPSPNMRNLNQALLYPGVGLVEFTNVSVGRGTDTPFEILGAPYVDARALAALLRGRNLPGVTFVPVEFVPDASKFKGELCRGVQILITDRDALDAIRTGMTLAWALHRLCPDTWEVDRFARLLAEPAAFERIRDGAFAEQAIATWLDELEEFGARRSKYLLYR
jgi:uncharacterized protein YbbC (DUF1343 family)